MNNSVYIRPLRVEDAQVSFAWRNNPKIWRLTGSRPDRFVTPELETEWIESVLKRTNERRFAICCSETGNYIGNVFLTNMTETSAYIHIFIGDINYWGGGRAVCAVMKLIEHSFAELGMVEVFTEINKRNLPSISLAKSCGFRLIKEYFNTHMNADTLLYVYTKEMFYEVMKRQQMTA